MELLIKLFNELYPEASLTQLTTLQNFLEELTHYQLQHRQLQATSESDWYKDAVIYSAYVDLFNHTFDGLTEKLDYLQQLGVNCLWLLPILESPMKDAGFDISDYTCIRADLLGLPETSSTEKRNELFLTFVKAAKERNIRIIFDIAMNHCSNMHPWFQEAKTSRNSAFRDYFIWSDTKELYKEARIIFKGICESNWEFEPLTQQYYFHRFFEIQPDLNYRNPQVLIEMSRVLAQWKLKGIDGFRADAVPYIWKEEGTICENLHKTHVVVKFFRAVLDYIGPGSLLLAEACQPPKDVVSYFGQSDECHAAYHFPVMPKLYKALAEELSTSIIETLHSDITPDIPSSCQWFMFLRCHDELTLEMVTPEERAYLYAYYAKNPLWDFRLGEGISSRLSELFDFDPQRILLAYSISFTLLGTPIIYYGDEVGKCNDEDYYHKTALETGYQDSRYLSRGYMNWDTVNASLEDPTSLGYTLYHSIASMLLVRKNYKAFSRGTLTFVDSTPLNPHVLSYIREYDDKKILILENLSTSDQYFSNSLFSSLLPSREPNTLDLLNQLLIIENTTITLKPLSFYWIDTTR
jgi:maltose alpha-D-glucosyltransferase / alpha-amylase